MGVGLGIGIRFAGPEALGNASTGTAAAEAMGQQQRRRVLRESSAPAALNKNKKAGAASDLRSSLG
jgi:hypothetical protein